MLIMDPSDESVKSSPIRHVSADRQNIRRGVESELRITLNRRRTRPHRDLIIDRKFPPPTPFPQLPNDPRTIPDATIRNRGSLLLNTHVRFDARVAGAENVT